MKKLLFGMLTIATGVVSAFIIASATALWVVKADGKTFIEIIKDAELVIRFIMAIITFSVLLILYARFVFYPLICRAIDSYETDYTTLRNEEWPNSTNRV